MNDQTPEKEKRALPFILEFLKFFAGFAALLALGFFTLHAAGR